MKKNPDVANSISYKSVKYHVQVLNITRYIKMRNLIKFGDLKILFVSFKKCEKIKDVANGVFHKPTKNQLSMYRSTQK